MLLSSSAGGAAGRNWAALDIDQGVTPPMVEFTGMVVGT